MWYSLIGAVLVLVVQKLGIKIPIINPSPAGPAVDKPLADCLDWLLKVKAGEVKMDDLDKETLKAIKAALSDLETK